MELHCAHVVHVALEGEHALFHLVVPHLNKMIITTTDKHRLCLMEIDASHGP